MLGWIVVSDLWLELGRDLGKTGMGWGLMYVLDSRTAARLNAIYWSAYVGF